jgi:hypothetical protein
LLDYLALLRQMDPVYNLTAVRNPQEMLRTTCSTAWPWWRRCAPAAPKGGRFRLHVGCSMWDPAPACPAW